MNPNDPTQAVSMMASMMAGGMPPGMMSGEEPGELVEHDPEEKSGMIEREVEENEISKAKEALIKSKIEAVKSSKAFFEKDFKRMRECMDFASGDQWPGEVQDAKGKYVANVTQRHLQQKVASLYAKNPKVICTRKKMMDFTVWDETNESLQSAVVNMQASLAGQIPMMPEAQMLVDDIVRGVNIRKQHEKQAETLQLLFANQIEAQEPNFKLQMKQLVRRTCITGVGYVKVAFQRIMERRPEDIEKVRDITDKMARLERLIADKLDGEIDEDKKELEELNIMLADLQNKQDAIVKEGLVFDFPASNSIIVDKRCRNLRTFLGAAWVAQEFIMSVDDVKEIYKKDLGESFTAYTPDGLKYIGQSDKPQGEKMCVVWEIYSKTDGQVYVVCDGYKDWLKEPAPPDVILERFWPIFTLTFNDVENDRRIYPQSDVELIMPMQREYNRSRQALREQRIANRPMYAVPDGLLDENDIKKLETRPNNAVVILRGLQPGQRITDVLQPVPAIPIDIKLYETDSVFADLMKVAGTQEANLGGVSGGTATESSIAEASRSAAIASNVDDLDDFLSEVARSCGQILLMNMSTETVQMLVGAGAVWSEMNAQEAADMLTLEIAAGSSGRPNKAAESANFQQLAPIIMQIPGVQPEWLLKQAVMRLDDRLDVTDAIAAGAQSIIAMNSQKQIGEAVDAESNPNMQGDKGGQNAAPAPQDAPEMPAAPGPEQMM